MKLDKPEWTAVSFSNRLTVNFPEEPYGKLTVVQFIKILSKAEASLNNICLKTCELFSGTQENSAHTHGFHLIRIFNKLCARPLETILYVYTVPESYCTTKYIVFIGLTTALINYPI